MYQIRILKTAENDLKRLDKSAGIRIIQRINWLAENLDSIKPQRLSGDLAGLFKQREGDYRIIYQVLRKENTIIIHCIGHRKDIYRTR